MNIIKLKTAPIKREQTNQNLNFEYIIIREQSPATWDRDQNQWSDKITLKIRTFRRIDPWCNKKKEKKRERVPSVLSEDGIDSVEFWTCWVSDMARYYRTDTKDSCSGLLSSEKGIYEYAKKKKKKRRWSQWSTPTNNKEKIKINLWILYKEIDLFFFSQQMIKEEENVEILKNINFCLVLSQR